MKKKFEDINIIAEIGTAHEGSFALACSYIKSAKKAGADAVKFQTHISEAESSVYDKFRVKSRFIDDKSRQKFWERTSFSAEQYKKLKNFTEGLGMFFLSSPFSIEAVDLLKLINIQAWKIGSGELTNYPLIDKIAQTKKPMIISTGLSDIKEIKETVKWISKYHKKIVILQCTSLYPCPDEKIGLNVISDLKKTFPYRHLTKKEFDETLDFVSTGGYSLSEYGKFHQIVKINKKLYVKSVCQVFIYRKIKKRVQRK